MKELDKKVETPAAVAAYIFGSISAIIMGTDMSLVMTDIGTQIGVSDSMVPGIAIGVVGLVAAVINYPMYKKILGKRREKCAKQIIALSDEIMKG